MNATRDGGASPARAASRSRLPLALLMGLAFTAPSAHAGTGEIVQLPGVTGCVSEGGSGGSCADGEALDGAQGLAVSGNGLSVYVASAASNGVAVFLSTRGGELAQAAGVLGCVTDDGTGGACTDGRALLGARDVELDKKARHLYVAAPASDAVAIFARAKTGQITQLAGTDGCVSLTGTGGACAVGRAIGGARAVAVGPKGKFVYVAARDDNAVAVFARDKKTGVLTQLSGLDGCVSEDGTGGQCTNGVALDFPTHVALSPRGDSAYVASVGSNAVAVFSRDKKTGVLTQLPGTDGCVSEDGSGGACADGRGLLGAFAVVVSKDGKFVYAAARDGNAVAAFARDKKTGVLTQLEGTQGCVSEDGSGGECADGAHLVGPVSLALPRDRRNLYVAGADGNAVAVFARDKKTGAITQLPGTDGCVGNGGSGGECGEATALVEPSAVEVTRNGRSVYVASSTSDAVAAFARDK